MISEVRATFNLFLRDKLKKWPDLYTVINNHELKETVIEKTCEELIRAGNRFDLRYNQRYDGIVQAAATLYMKRLISTLEYQRKSDAEKTRIKKAEDIENFTRDYAETHGIEKVNYEHFFKEIENGKVEKKEEETQKEA